MAGDNKSEDATIAKFQEAMEKANVAKIANEILACLLDDFDDSEDFDSKENTDETEERPLKPSHVISVKSTVKARHIDAMKGKYFHDASFVRQGGEDIVPDSEKDEVVVYRSFMEARLRFTTRILTFYDVLMVS
jgi:hypothetical protein